MIAMLGPSFLYFVHQAYISKVLGIENSKYVTKTDVFLLDQVALPCKYLGNFIKSEIDLGLHIHISTYIGW